MSENLLFHEYSARLSEGAALFLADKGAQLLAGRQATWTASMGGVSVDLDLDVQAAHPGCMVPSLRLGSSCCLPQDVLVALVMLRDNEETLCRAASAWAKVRGIRVWMDAAPCDYCGTRGNDRGTPCVQCKGLGKRMNPESVKAAP